MEFVLDQKLASFVVCFALLVVNQWFVRDKYSLFFIFVVGRTRLDDGFFTLYFDNLNTFVTGKII